MPVGPQLAPVEEGHAFRLHLRLVSPEEHAGRVGLPVDETVERVVVELERKPHHQRTFMDAQWVGETEPDYPGRVEREQLG